ncbi:RidA family protein [Actinomadura verrucosospora]|uniref:Endoribonuclease L-PSP domain-containing protein n=1 Tax=Actinomadura verrucosospora TaxID=46165 RepID=A0A7D3ZI80_ACTVE|nr:RidA family protein [Actinomadura verrucosospora]QKG18742.1 endoribonuclease L-PSP domain-containing protein [Actinomadura verrucosospora]
MDPIERRLSELGAALPAPIAAPPGVALQLRFVTVAGSSAYLSGHGPADGPRRLARGKVGADLTVEQGRAAARQCALAALATLKREFGELARVRRWIKVTGYVNCTPDFEQTPAVVNGFSDLIIDLWGDAGRHARSAVGVRALPFAVPVEVEAVVEIA